MGNGIAHVVLRGRDTKVILRDVEQRFLDRGMETIGKNLDPGNIKKGKNCGFGEGNSAWSAAAGDRYDGHSAADFGVEAVPREKSRFKRAVLGEADGFCGRRSSLASQHSSISMTALAALTKGGRTGLWGCTS